MQRLMIYYYILINILLLLMMAYDKKQAIKKRWRIRERSLILIGFLGGAIGGFLAMALYRHKTKKPLFTVSYSLALFIHIYIIWLLFYKF